jgi:hypothetical protein
LVKDVDFFFQSAFLQVNASRTKGAENEEEGENSHCKGNAIECDVFFHVIIFFWNQPRGLKIRKRLA